MEQHIEKKEYFPFFLTSTGKQVLVIGGGHVATSRVRTLLRFNFTVEVVALEVSEEIEEYEKQGLVKVLRRRALAADIQDQNNDYICIATDDHAANLRFVSTAKLTGKPVNVSDSKELCDFFFPAVATSAEFTAGVVGEGYDVHEVAKCGDRIQEVL